MPTYSRTVSNAALWSLSVAFAAALAGAGAGPGCGGSSPPPETPAAAASSEAPKAASSGESSPAAASAPSGDSAEAASGASPEADSEKKQALPAGIPGEKPSRPPHEILQLKDTVFMLAFDDSDPGKAAQAACAKASDPKKHSACMRQAREKLDVPDGHRFKQKGDDWVWLAVRLRKNNTLTNLHKVKFEFGDETENTITLKLDPAGAKAAKQPGEVKIEVPSDYRIVMHDPKHGKLIYEAKVGIAGGGD